MKRKLKQVCEKLNWNVYEYENDIELEKYSPAGENFIFSVNKKNCIEEIKKYILNFDADEHAEMWINNMHTVSGVPQSVRILINDADAIQDMLNELADSL